MINKIINGGRGSQPKVERNMKMASDYKSGVDPMRIAYTNGISTTRFYEIMKALGVPTTKRKRTPTL